MKFKTVGIYWLLLGKSDSYSLRSIHQCVNTDNGIWKLFRDLLDLTYWYAWYVRRWARN